MIPEKDLNHIFLAQRLSREEADQKYSEQIYLRDNASKKSKGNSMINQIQRIAKMKQQNLDDATLQQIESQVDESNFEDSVLNGQLNDEFTNYLEDHSEDSDSGVNDNHNEDDYISQKLVNLIGEDIDENDDYANYDNEQQCQISDVDINLNDIVKSSVHEAGIDRQVESELHAESSCLTNNPFIVDSCTNLNEYQEIAQENIPFQFGGIQKHNTEEFITEQSFLEKSIDPDKDVIIEPISTDSDKLSDSINSEDELSPSIPIFYLDSTGHVKPEFMHLYNASPPAPPSSEDDFTDQLVKKIADMEKSVEKEEVSISIEDLRQLATLFKLNYLLMTLLANISNVIKRRRTTTSIILFYYLLLYHYFIILLFYCYLLL